MMAITQNAEATTHARLDQVRASFERDIVASTENVRWLTTLVLATMAGVAAYRTGGDDPPGLGPAYALLLFLFGLSLAVFVLSTIKARFERAGFAERFHDTVVEISGKLSELAVEDRISPAEGGDRLLQYREERIEALPASFGWATALELAGLVIFAVAAVLAALMIFFSELLVFVF